MSWKKKLPPILMNATGNVIGMIIKAAELFDEGPSGLIHGETPNTVTVVWDMYRTKQAYLLNFTFEKNGRLKAWELINRSLPEQYKILLRKLTVIIFDYATIKQKQGGLRGGRLS